MRCNTKISKGCQTAVPSKIRKHFNVGPNDVVEWKLTDKGLTVNLRKKVEIEDIIGMINTEKRTNAVELKKRIQRGEKITLDNL